MKVGYPMRCPVLFISAVACSLMGGCAAPASQSRAGSGAAQTGATRAVRTAASSPATDEGTVTIGVAGLSETIA